MKKIKYLLLVAALMICLTGCGDKQTSPEDKKKVLTEERVLLIEKHIYLQSEKLNYRDLKSTYKDDIVRAANARVSAGSYDVKGVRRFDSFTFRYGEKDGEYDYVVYGTLSGVSEYGYAISRDVVATFYCKNESEEECKVYYEGFSIGD